ncbi:hypothetical protein PYW07_006433 [Mythimna separata]|uniref:Uncharacterized protein n=1 Tax=Mythimna separata TaxID=271217 RepID=A0AAD7YWA5_MYTSE|nr:hypothetical protein PYW07_006433 [Mythimna separata]
MIQQTLHKSMFIKTRSNSVGALPQEVAASETIFNLNDQNTWQQDRIPLAKRKRVGSKSPQIENAKKKPSMEAYTIPTQNQFEILSGEEDKTDNIETEKPPKPEPIFPKHIQNNIYKSNKIVDEQQPRKLRTYDRTTATYAAKTKNNTESKINPDQPLQIEQLGDILEQMFNRIQTMMLNMVNNMMDRFVQLISSQFKK